MKTALLVTFAVALTNASTSRAEQQVDAAANELSAILQPYVHPLDRDLWTFRYEGEKEFQATNVADLQNRLAPWTERFWNAEIVNGADTGPGVYVATDPASTATWGGPQPSLFAIKIKAGINILAGDQYRTPPDVLSRARSLSDRLACGSSPTSMDEDVGHLVGFFRMNANVLCRQVAIGALKALDVKALSYSFNSVPLEGCRTTGTAISIISAAAISLGELNRYSGDGNIEGQPRVSPYVHLLFEEAKSDYYTQSLLWSRDVWKSYLSGYGFFANTPDADRSRYETWKAKHILKCGTPWSLESGTVENPELVGASEMRKHPNLRVEDVLVRMALVYREKFRNFIGLPANTEQEFDPNRLWKLKRRLLQDHKSQLKVFTAQVPDLTGFQTGDEEAYVALLKSCLSAYETQTTMEILHGSCRVEPWE